MSAQSSIIQVQLAIAVAFVMTVPAWADGPAVPAPTLAKICVGALTLTDAVSPQEDLQLAHLERVNGMAPLAVKDRTLFFALLRELPRVQLQPLFVRYVELKRHTTTELPMAVSDASLLRLAAVSLYQGAGFEAVADLLGKVIVGTTAEVGRAVAGRSMRPYVSRQVLVQLTTLIIGSQRTQGSVIRQFAQLMAKEIQAGRQSASGADLLGLILTVDPAQLAVDQLRQQLCSSCYP